MIRIHVNCSKGPTFPIELTGGINVVGFKKFLAKISKIPANQLRLIYGGNTLEDDRNLYSYGLKDGDTIFMEVTQKPLFVETERTPPSDTTTVLLGGLGSQIRNIRIHIICSNAQMFTVESSAGSKVVDFKELLAERTYFPANEQRLIYRGNTLEDDQTLRSYGLKEDHTIYMELDQNPNPLAETETTPPPSDTTTGALGLQMGKMIMIDIISLKGDMFSVRSSVRSKVVDFKALLAEISTIPANEQRLIYKGNTLEDDRTLDSYGLKEYHTVHIGISHNSWTGGMAYTSLLYTAISQITQTLLSSHQLMMQIIDQDQQLNGMLDSNPQLTGMIQNHEEVRRLILPEMTKVMMQERIRIGRELLEMEEDNERKRIIALHKAEKEEEKRAREKIRQKLEEDKAGRRRKLGLLAEDPTAPKPATPVVEEKKAPESQLELPSQNSIQQSIPSEDAAARLSLQPQRSSDMKYQLCGCTILAASIVAWRIFKS